MKLLAKIAVIAVVFVAVADLAEQIAAHIPGTPPNDLNAAMRKAVTAKGLAATLSSATGCALLTAHSKWIIFIYLPVASLAASVIARVVNVSTKLAIGIVVVLFALRIGLMAVASRAYADLASICGAATSGVGTSPLEVVAAFFLCVCLAGAVLCIRRGTSTTSG